MEKEWKYRRGGKARGREERVKAEGRGWKGKGGDEMAKGRKGEEEEK